VDLHLGSGTQSGITGPADGQLATTALQPATGRVAAQFMTSKQGRFEARGRAALVAVVSSLQKLSASV
jgi:hypothetical protein